MRMDGPQHLTTPEFDWFVGIDWGSVTHVVRVTDAGDRSVGERTVPHSGAGLRELVHWLRTVADSRMERVAWRLKRHGARSSIRSSRRG